MLLRTQKSQNPNLFHTDEYCLQCTNISHTRASHRQMPIGQWLLTQISTRNMMYPQGGLDIEFSILSCILSQGCSPES